MTKRFSLKLFLFVLLITSFLIVLRVFFLDTYPDFTTNYYSATHALSHQTPYGFDARYFTSQVYPPVAIIFYIPFTPLTEDIVVRIWVGLNLLLVIASVFLLTKIYKSRFFSYSNTIFLTLLFLAFPLKFTLGMGQVNGILLFFVCLWFYFFKQKKDILAGSFLAFPLLIKFYPVLLIPYVMYLKRWKVLVGIAGFGIYLFCISLYFISWETQVHFLTTILPSLLTSWKGDYYNQALSGVLMRGIGDPILRNGLKLGISSILVLITTISILSRAQSEKRHDLSIAALLTVTILINNFSWQHHYLFLLLPFYILFTHIQSHVQKVWLYGILFIAYILIAYNIVSPVSYPSIFLSHVFLGGMILWTECIYLLWNEAH